MLKIYTKNNTARIFASQGSNDDGVLCIMSTPEAYELAFAIQDIEANWAMAQWDNTEGDWADYPVELELEHEVKCANGHNVLVSANSECDTMTLYVRNLDDEHIEYVPMDNAYAIAQELFANIKKLPDWEMW